MQPLPVRLPSGAVTEPTDVMAALRRVISAARIADLDAVSEEDLASSVVSLEAVAERLELEAVDEVRMQSALRTGELQERFGAVNSERRSHVLEFGLENFFPYSPYIGALNPVAPPIEFRTVPGKGWVEIEAEHVFGAVHNGPPGAVHGGVISGVIDELLGSVCVINDVSGFTGTLTIRYRAPTPLDQPIRMRGWIEHVEGRKAFAAATFHDGDTLCAEAEGVFISFPADVLP